MIRLLTAALLVTSFSSAYPDDYNNYDITPLGAAIDGDAANGYAGYSVSLASNGSRLAVGARLHDGANGVDSGRTRVYEWDGSSWSPLGAAIDGDAAYDYAGTSVSLASNGSRLAVGADGHDGANGVNSGRTRVYEWDGSSWSPLGAAIDGDAVFDYAGTSVSLASNGSRLAVGAYAHDGANGENSGRTRVYEWDGSSWSPLGAAIDGDALNGFAGTSVSLASNGSRLAVGARLHDGANGVNSGRTRVYEWDGSSWSPLGAAIDGDAAFDYAGTSVSLASNGSRLAVGADGHDGANGVNSGRTRVYEWDGSSWSPLGAAIDGDAAGDAAGTSVSLASNGSRLAVGAYAHDGANGVDSGRTRVYEWDGSSWSPLGAAIDGDAAGGYAGYTVSLASNGSRLAVGVPLHDGANGGTSGRTRVYQISLALRPGVIWFLTRSKFEGDEQAESAE